MTRNTSYGFTAFVPGESLDDILAQSEPACHAAWADGQMVEKQPSGRTDPCFYLGRTCDDELLWASRGLAWLWLVVSFACVSCLGGGACVYMMTVATA